MDINSGRELDLRNTNSLQGELFDVDKNTYENTLCIGEHGAAPGKELASEMANYLANLATTGSADIDKDKAIQRLKEEKKKYDTRPFKAKVDTITEELLVYEKVDEELKEIRGKISEVEQEFAMETAKRKREARKLIESDKGTTYEENEELNEGMDELAKKAVFLDADLIKDYKKELPLTDRVWFILLTGLFVVGVIAAMVYILPFETGVRQLFIICTILFVIVTIVEGMYSKGMLNGDIYTPSEEDFKKMIYDLERKQETFEEVEIDMTFAKEFLDRKAELLAVEKEILDKKEKKRQLEEELKVANDKIEELDKENHIINLAINTINQVSAEIHGDLGFLINDNISDIVSKITDGKYQDVKMDEKLHIMVKDSDSYLGIEYLSAGTIEQIYLAVRLSVARLLCKDRMPLIIDDIFTAYDESRLVNTLDCLKTIDTEQIILMTSNPHIGDMLDELDMDYNYVEL